MPPWLFSVRQVGSLIFTIMSVEDTWECLPEWSLSLSLSFVFVSHSLYFSLLFAARLGPNGQPISLTPHLYHFHQCTTSSKDISNYSLLGVINYILS
jgi:hypothetical protein